MTITELKQYVADKRKRKAIKWKKEVDNHGYCKPFTDSDYSKNREIIFTGRKSYTNKITSTKLWETY